MPKVQNQAKIDEKGEYIITVPCENLFFYIPHVKIEKVGNECHVYLKSKRHYQFGVRIPPVPIDVRRKLIKVLRLDDEKLIEYINNFVNVDRGTTKLIKTTVTLDAHDAKKLLKLAILTQVKVSKVARILITYDLPT